MLGIYKVLSKHLQDGWMDRQAGLVDGWVDAKLNGREEQREK